MWVGVCERINTKLHSMDQYQLSDTRHEKELKFENLPVRNIRNPE